MQQENTKLPYYKKDRRKEQVLNIVEKRSIFLSVIIPLLNEKESLPELTNQIVTVLTENKIMDYEIIFVDDGSKDGSFEVIKNLRSENNRVHCIRFRRNYGKSAALSVGFENAKGKFVITMDADLQDDPKEIPALLAKLKEGYDLVSGWKRKRYDPISKTLPSKLFNTVTSMVSGVKLHDFNCGLKAYRRDVVKSLYVYGEMHRYLPALAYMDGYRVTEIPVQHHPRKYGYTKFGLSRFLYGFLDLLTVLVTSKYMKRPLHFFGLVGFILVFLGIIVDGILSIEWFMGETNLSNRPLLWFGIALIIVGVQFISLGLIAELIIKYNMVNNKNNNYSIIERI